MLLDKKNALYVKGCIIANGITDSQCDTLYAEDIKKIFTSFNNQDNFEIYHEDTAIPEVSLLENYISTADETLGTNIVPSGSWCAVIRVDNPEIKEALLTGEFRGLSLSNRIAKPCRKNLHGTIRYQDVQDAECVVPRFISFVEGGANGYSLVVMDYDAYIHKSEDVVIENSKGGKNMAFNLLDGLKSLIKQAEEDAEEPVVEKDDEVQDDKAEDETANESEDEPAIEKADESEDKDDESEEDPEIKKDDGESEDKDDDEPVVEKDDDTEISLEDRVAKLEAIVAELKAKDESADETNETPAEDETEEPVDEDTPKITKSKKVIIENKTAPTQTNYYKLSGRDPITGKKIRK